MSYVPVVATVVESGIVSRRKGRAYRSEVRYRYAVDGKEYVSSRVAFYRTATWASIRGGPSREDAAAAAARHPVASTVRAYYDPANPSHAVLDVSPPSGSPLKTILLIVVGVVVLSSLKAVRAFRNFSWSGRRW